MSLAQRKQFLHDVFQITAIALVSVINHYHINGFQLYNCISYGYLPPPPEDRMWLKVNFKRSLISLNSEFSFTKTGYHTKVKEPSLSYS